MIDFIVRGTPRSQQARRRKRWQQEVQEAVPAESSVMAGPLRLRIDFFFNGSTQLDTDNIIKPIQDALKAVVYEDDEAVIDVCARKIDLQQLPTLVAPPPTLSSALTEPLSDFVFVRVARAHPRLAFS